MRSLAARDGFLGLIVEVSPSETSDLVSRASETRGYCENTDCAKLQVRATMKGGRASVMEDLCEATLLMEVTPEGLISLHKAMQRDKGGGGSHGRLPRGALSRVDTTKLFPPAFDGVSRALTQQRRRRIQPATSTTANGTLSVSADGAISPGVPKERPSGPSASAFRRLVWRLGGRSEASAQFTKS